MQLNDIFSKPVDRPIEGVIKANDESGLQIEVEEYVITKEVNQCLGKFLETYLDFQGGNGAWVSGFFGSGKSHLLKVMAFLLENRAINGMAMLDYFLPKCEQDEFLKGNLRRAAQIPSHSILFNIDQKADTISRDDSDAVLAVFVKVFNEMCGYYGKWGYVAQLERDMEEQGVYQDFQAAYQQISGKAWLDERHLALGKRTQIAQTYARVTGSSEEHVKDIIKEYRDDYKLSIEDFAHMVKTYIDAQAAGFRLNFFVDEVGQYIAEDTKLMTNLQTIAESLATICGGRSWIIVTAQEDMDTVLGEMSKKQESDFSKIQDRFKVRMKLTSANVDEVIATRLLLKNETGEQLLKPLYGQQKNNFGTLFDFSAGGRSYRNYRHEQHFIDIYPFVPYQFELFQQAIKNLSDHNAFEGRHTSVGARSMLGVFQEVAVRVKDQPVGTLATFDRMFTGVRTVLKSQTQMSIQIAENNLDNEFAIRVLKALFLVKYVKDFKATPHNIRVLMLDGFAQDLNKLGAVVEAALNLLEQQTYIQRNGDEYEFLTDEEKDIEQEIKNTQVDAAEFLDEVKEMIFDGIIKANKMRHADSQQDFDFTKKVDHKIYGREAELTIQVISPEHEYAENPTALSTMSMGLPVLLIALPADNRFVADLYLYRKTLRFIQQNSSNALSDSVSRILGEKSLQNQRRHEGLRLAVRDLAARAGYYVNGTRLELNSQDALTNIQAGFSELGVRTHTHLAMLRGIEYKESEIGHYLSQAQDALFDQNAYENNEAQEELLTTVQRVYQEQQRVTLYNLVSVFTHKPYGWSLAAVQCLLALLHNRGRLEMRADSNILEGRALVEALKNTHGFPNVLLEPQIEFTKQQIYDLKDFYRDFFDDQPAATDGRALGKECNEAFQKLAGELATLYKNQPQYPFLAALAEPLPRIEALAKQPYAYFLTDLQPEAEALLDLKEQVIAPIRRFMGGEQKTTYDEIMRFLNRQEANFTNIPPDDPAALYALLQDPHCYQGSRMIEARKLMGSIREAIEAQLVQERAAAQAAIGLRKDELQASAEFSRLNAGQQAQFAAEFDQFSAGLQTLTVIASVRDSRRRFEVEVYPALLTRVSSLAAPPVPPPDELASQKGIAEPHPIQTVSIQTIRPQTTQLVLTNEADVEAYLAHIKAALLEAIRSGKRISL